MIIIKYIFDAAWDLPKEHDTFTYTKNLPTSIFTAISLNKFFEFSFVIKNKLLICLYFYLESVPDGALLRKKRIQERAALPTAVSIKN